MITQSDLRYRFIGQTVLYRHNIISIHSRLLVLLKCLVETIYTSTIIIRVTLAFMSACVSVSLCMMGVVTRSSTFHTCTKVLYNHGLLVLLGT